MNEIGKAEVKVEVIHNGLEKYMAFTKNKNLVNWSLLRVSNS